MRTYPALLLLPTLWLAVCSCGRLGTASAQRMTGNSPAASSPLYATTPSCAPGRDPNVHGWADEATDALWFNFYTQTGGYFGDGWGFAQAMDFVTDGARRTAGINHLDKLSQMVARYGSISYSPYTPTYYDDHAWMALALVRAAIALQQTPALQNVANQTWQDARKEYAIIQQGFDPNTQRVFWTADQHNWVTASNATSSMVACAIYEGGGRNPNDLQYAKVVYDAWRSVVFNANSGEVDDGLNKGSTQVDTGQYTYNYGTMTGAALCLHRNTGIASYFADANSIMAHLSANMVQQSMGDEVLTEPGCISSACTGDGALFKGVGMRYLATLSRMDPNDLGLLNVVLGSAHSLYTTGRNGTQLSSVWQHTPFSADGLEAQISGGMGIAAAAEDASGSTQARTLGLYYEAENQNLLGLARVASTAATNLGYVDSTATDGTGIEFGVITPYSGPHRLIFSIGAVAAGVRQVQTSGQSVQLRFGNTSSVTQFATASVDANLSVGYNVVSLMYIASQNASSEAAIDNLRIYPLSSPQAQGAALPAPMPVMPLDGVGQATTTRFGWQPVSGATSYALIVDDMPVAHLSGEQNAATLDANTLGDGPHRWYVVASNGAIGTPGPQASFVFCGQEPPVPTNFVVSDSPAGLTVGWPGLDMNGCIQADVRLGGLLRCAQLSVNQCIVAGASLSDVDSGLEVRFFNNAHETVLQLDATGLASQLR